MTHAQLRAERGRQVDALEELLGAAEATGRVLNADEQDRFDRIKRAIGRLDEQLEETRMEPNEPQGFRPLVTVPTRLSDAIPADISRQVEAAGRCAFEVKTSLRVLAEVQRNIVGGGTLTTPNTNVTAPVSWRLVDGYVSPPSLLELLPREPVTGGSIIQNVVTYTPPNNTGLKAAEVAEAATKPESDVTCTASTIAFKTYAHWISCTRQVLSDAPALRQLLDSVLTRGLMAKVDAALLAALTTAGGTFAPPAGANGIDSAAMAAAQLACMGGTGVVVLMNCMDAAAAALAKTSAGAYLGRPAELAGRIIPSPIVPAGTLIAFSREAGLVAEREAVNCFAGVKNDDLTKDLLTIVCEWRGALILSQPSFILTGPLAASGTSAQAQAAHARRA